jgi:hypothetical protein
MKAYEESSLQKVVLMMDEHPPRVSSEDGNQPVEEIRSILLQLKDIQTKPTMVPLWDRETSVIQALGSTSEFHCRVDQGH